MAPHTRFAPVRPRAAHPTPVVPPLEAEDDHWPALRLLEATPARPRRLPRLPAAVASWLAEAEALAAHCHLQRAADLKGHGVFGRSLYAVRTLPNGHVTLPVRYAPRTRRWGCPCTWAAHGLPCEHVGAASMLRRATQALTTALLEGLRGDHAAYPQAMSATRVRYLVSRDAAHPYATAAVDFDAERLAVTFCAHDGHTCGDLPTCAHAGAVLIRTGAWLTAQERKERRA